MRDVFPGNPIDCLISIGTGISAKVALHSGKSPTFIQKALTAPAKVLALGEALKHIATNSEATHYRLERAPSKVGSYFRFNAGKRIMDKMGKEDWEKCIGLEDWEQMDKVVSITQEYLREDQTQIYIKKCADILKSSPLSA